MSLHAAAQHLSSKGRGPDNTLVHMSRDEVKSLNDLAMAHGGHLTVNPQTGLPEAGFLSSILPMVAGAALAATGIGLPMAALMVGGGTTLMTGDLKKGLMAGLGAYGGAGLGSSLMGAGAAEAASAASAAAPEVAAAAAPEAALTAPFSTPVAAPSSLVSNALPPAPSAFTPAQVASMPGTNFAPSVNPTVSAPIAPPTTVTPPPDLSYMTRGMGATPASASASTPLTFSENLANMKRGFTGENLMNYAKENPYQVASMAASALMPDESKLPGVKRDFDMGQRYSYEANKASNPFPTPDSLGRENLYFTPTYTKISNERAKELYGFAGGGPIETMSNANAIGANTGYPMADISKGAYATPYQTPISRNVLSDTADTGVNPISGEMAFARGGLSDAAYNLGGYSDGGRLLRGPGDGVSDSIPAVIGKKQPARLADGEFVVPARIVSELGNGSTEAGARKLYAMMDRVQKARGKTVGKNKVAKNSRADKYLPA